MQRNGSITHKKLYANSMLDLVDAYEHNHKKMVCYSENLTEVSYYRLLWAYRETIYRIASTDDWRDHKKEIKEIQYKIKINLNLCLRNSFMSYKQKMATILSLYAPNIYKKMKL